MLQKKQHGFTLIEVLLVIGIIAMLAAIVIIAINPARQFAQTRNTQRWSNVNAILNGIHQNMADNRGVWTCDVDGDDVNDALPSSATNMGSAVGDYDICACLVPTYIAEMPYDPETGSFTDCDTAYDTDYTVFQSTGGRVTVEATGELSQIIKVTR